MTSEQMIIVHILTNPMTTQNVRGFLTPLLVNERRLRLLGIRLRIFNGLEADLESCDVLMVNAKYYGKRWNDNTQEILDELSSFAQKVGALLYCDNYDSTAPIRTEVLPIVRYYFKNMLLRDRSLYSQPFYGGRIFTDYYHRCDGIDDNNPQHAEPITDPSLVAKLQLSWNYGLAHYGLLGGRVAALYGKVPIRQLIRLPARFTAPSADRPNDISCRLTTNYPRQTIAYHRKRIMSTLSKRVDMARVGRVQFYRELTNSKIVVSPFGWGEFSLRDFEAFLCGALLLKPDMSHLETYPDFYRDGETIVTHHWDLHDLEEKIDGVLDDYDRFVGIARNGQDLYRYYLSVGGKEEFAVRFQRIMKDALAQPASSAAQATPPTPSSFGG